MTQIDPFNEGANAARARRMRSIMMALALVGFVALIFIVTMVRLHANAQHVVPQTL